MDEKGDEKHKVTAGTGGIFTRKRVHRVAVEENKVHGCKLQVLYFPARKPNQLRPSRSIGCIRPKVSKRNWGAEQ